MRRVLACMIVAACGGGTGIALEVTAPSSTETVELFMGNALVQKTEDNRALCSSNMPDMCAIYPADPDAQNESDFTVGHGWVGMATKSTRSTATDGVFGFSLEPDSEQHIPALLLVGLDGNEMPTGYALLHDLDVDSSPEVMRIKLSPAQYIVPATPNVDRVQVWRRFDDDARARSACAVIQKADRATEWFVPADDTDCDSAQRGDPAAAECYQGEWAHCGVFAGDLATASCVRNVPSTSGNTPTCRWAGPECADNPAKCGAGEACEPTQQIACFPPEVCTQVGSGCNTFDPNDSVTCVPKALSVATGSNVAPWLSCSFYMEDATTPCNNDWPTLDSFDTAVLTQGTACQRLELAKFGLPVTIAQKVPANLLSDVEIQPVDGCIGSEFRISFNGGGTPLEGNALLGMITTDYKRRYVLLHTDVYFGCQTTGSFCAWKGPVTDYTFTCE